MIKEAIMKLSQKQDIGYEMAKAVMDEIMSDEASDVQKSAYLVEPVRKELGIRTIFNILGPWQIRQEQPCRSWEFMRRNW